jgi:hypothetical protein
MQVSSFAGETGFTEGFGSALTSANTGFGVLTAGVIVLVFFKPKIFLIKLIILSSSCYW